MVDIALLQSVSYIAGALGVCVAAIFYVLNLRISQMNVREAERNKKIQLSMSIGDRLGSKEFLRDHGWLWTLDWKDTDDFMKKYDDTVKGGDVIVHWAERWSVWSAFNNLGYILREGLVEDETLFNSSGFLAVPIWGKYWPIIDHYRRRELGRGFMENFEFLAKTMWRIGKARGWVSPGVGDVLAWDRFKAVFEPEAAVSASQ